MTVNVCVCMQTDLEHTLGESASLGAAGVVLWGEMKFAQSKVCDGKYPPAFVWLSVFNHVSFSCIPATVHPPQKLHPQHPGSIRSLSEVWHPALQPPTLPRQRTLCQATPQLRSRPVFWSLLWSSRGQRVRRQQILSQTLHVPVLSGMDRTRVSRRGGEWTEPQLIQTPQRAVSQHSVRNKTSKGLNLCTFWQ